jgi:hypothetical protein
MKPGALRRKRKGRSLVFPKSARTRAGYELFMLQAGRDQTGAFRVVYGAKFEDAVYVLHAFQKKSRKTSPSDLKLARQRYRDARDLAKGTSRGEESD